MKTKPYERTEERQDYRNSYYSVNLITRVVTLALKGPRLHNGKFNMQPF
ncbi:transposase [Caldicellulosiruptor saccharolyticus]|nr:transposase [Caldicellulosiruptor saccharolyticus]